MMKQMALGTVAALAIIAGMAGPALSAACMVHRQIGSFSTQDGCTTDENGNEWNVFDRDGTHQCLGWKCTNPQKEQCESTITCP
jgi:hypothetical protein